METLFAVAVAVGVLRAHNTPPVEPPKVTVACSEGSHRTASGCVRDKPQTRSSKADWQIGY